MASAGSGLPGTLGHYHLAEKIGEGGMGTVYRAHDEHLDRDVAIKLLAPEALADAESRARFRNEALLLSKLNHPNIATIFDFDSQGGTEFIVTEFIPGISLSERLKTGPLRESEVLELGIQLAEGLATAHDQGVLHRDIKPSNLFVTTGDHLKILDFGLAVRMPPLTGVTAENDVPVWAGTLAYMAPEQLRGERADARSDIYSVGAVLYEMATGRMVFPEDRVPVLVEAILHGMPPRPTSCNPLISSRLEEIVLRCLEKNPADRYLSARTLVSDLRRATIAGSGRERTIAVLYFENLGGKSSEEYFRDGITEDITTELSRIKDLRVFSRSSVLAFRDKPVTPAYVAQLLDVSHVLEGSVRRDANRIRVTAKLVDTKTGFYLWAEKFDRELQDVFAIQDEIARKIVQALEIELSESDQRRLGRPPTRNLEAYEFYLRGRQYFYQSKRKSIECALEMFSHATQRDERYALAYAGVADCYSYLYMYFDADERNLELADTMSRKALELDLELAEAHAARGLAVSLGKQYEEAQREFETAIRLNARLFEAYYFYARTCFAQGKYAQASDLFEHAGVVKPEDYQAPFLLAFANRILNRTPEEKAAHHRTLENVARHLALNPDDARALYIGATTLLELGDKEKSLQWVQRAYSLASDDSYIVYGMACYYCRLGRIDDGIHYFEKAVEAGFSHKDWIVNDRDLDPLRNSPRFAAALRSIEDRKLNSRSV